jgi:hypothetical protein
MAKVKIFSKNPADVALNTYLLEHGKDRMGNPCVIDARVTKRIVITGVNRYLHEHSKVMLAGSILAETEVEEADWKAYLASVTYTDKESGKAVCTDQLIQKRIIVEAKNEKEARAIMNDHDTSSIFEFFTTKTLTERQNNVNQRNAATRLI